MKPRWTSIASQLLLLGASLALVAHAQKQTDIAASIDGTLSASTTSGGVAQSASNSAGGLLELRHIVNQWVGFEATYAYNRANQAYVATTIHYLYPPCPTSGNCPPIKEQPVAAVSANAHTITGDWIVSRKLHSLQLFALAGGGLLLFIPSGGQRYTRNAEEFTFVFGAGLDWQLSRHFGLRLQDREAIYKTPILATAGLYPNLADSTFPSFAEWNQPQVYTTTQEPALGVYYQF